MQLSLAKNQVNVISLAAILEGQTQAEAISFKYLALERKNARSSHYFEISGGRFMFEENVSALFRLLGQLKFV